MSLKTNDQGYIYFDSSTLNAIFDCVYDFDENGCGLKADTKKLLKERQFRDFIQMLKRIQQYKYHYRFEPTNELFSIFEAAVGPMNRNSDGTTLWLAMGLAIKELYGFSRDTLLTMLKLVTIRK